MGRITSGIGLVSGINSRDIIDQLMQIEARSKTLLQQRIDKTNQRKLAFTDLSTRLTSLRISATTLKKPSTFTQAQTTSSNENVLTATAAAGASVGSYTFQVARLVTSQQSVTRGFADADKTRVGAGTITLEMGGGDLKKQVNLSDLRGGEGIRRGVFRITDRSGVSASIDISSAVTLEDVVKKINTSLDIGVRASIGRDGLVLTDISGGSGQLTVQDLGGGFAAQDLGIANSVAGSVQPDQITGGVLNYMGRSTTLSSLNDGRGVRQATGNDFAITVGGSVVNIDLGTARTLGDVIDRINTDGAGVVRAEISADRKGITLIDVKGGNDVVVTALNNSKAAADLGILGTGTGGTLAGQSLDGALNSVSLAALNGGKGLTLGQMSITDRNGASAIVDLSSATTVQDVLDIINNTGGINVTARLNAAGNGIEIVDNTGAGGNLIIAEAGGDTAEQLGLLGTYDLNAKATGKNLQRQWVTEAMALSNYNGGKGVSQGSFKITAANGQSATIDLSKQSYQTLGEIIDLINSRQIGVVASINETGDGLLLTDTTGGAGKMKVEDLSGTAAADLRIAGEAKDSIIDGSFEISIEISATDTLNDVRQKINDTGFGAFASVINDGSGAAPFRLSLNARNGGYAGRFVFDAGTTALATQTLVDAQDAAVFLGGNGAEQPLLITSSRNQITGVIPGVTLDLHGVSDTPVTLNVSSTPDKAIETIRKFTEDFNAMIEKINELTKFDTETNKAGLLLGDSTVRRIQSEVYAALTTAIDGAGKFRVLAQIGLRVGSGAVLEFDEEVFREAYAQDAEAVSRLFTALTEGLTEDMPVTQLNDGRGLRTQGEGINDLRITLKDGTALELSLFQARTIRDVINAINDAGKGKIVADISSDGQSLRLRDTTTGSESFAVTAINGSQAAYDLGLTVAAEGDIIDGSKIAALATGGGIGSRLEQRINRLIDPVTGIITRENQKLDTVTDQFQDRIEQLDKILEAKRQRLERQFAQMESILASLQSQQQSLSSIQYISMPSSNK